MDDYCWAQDYPDVYKICKLFNLTGIQNPTNYRYKSVPSVTQDGPQCGLVALAMLLENPTKETVDNLLTDAKKCDYTYNGEMFSANNMCEFAKKYLPDRKIELHDGYLTTHEIKQFLLRGGFILVPMFPQYHSYDADKDHSPCFQQGHKAHWAVITGAVENAEEFFVLARHGKSKNVGVWKLDDLAESNAQLVHFSPDRKLSDTQYKLPEGGISGRNGLNAKAVLIYDEYKIL